MAFDIYQIDKIDFETDDSEKILEKYTDKLLELFSKSPEGLERLEAIGEIGFWSEQFINLCFNYLGKSLAGVRADDVRELLIDIFPRKISFDTAEEFDGTLPELMAFWQFLKREFSLPNADTVLRSMSLIAPVFKKEMMNPKKWGMAKSFFSIGRGSRI